MMQFKDDKGYVWVSAPSGHPYARRKASVGHSGAVKRCRLVMEGVIGAFLPPTIHIHHINENREDDHPDNLAAMTASAHRRTHWNNPRKRIGAPDKNGKCVRCGGSFAVSTPKRGLCNACYIQAKRWRAKTGNWPEYALKFKRLYE